MATVSNTIIATINFAFTVFGIIALSTGLYIYTHEGSSRCEKLIQNPLLIIGLIGLVISLLGLAGSCWKNDFLLLTYLGLVLFSIIGLIAFTIFTFLVFQKSSSGSVSAAGKLVSGLGFKECKLEDFSKFLQNHSINPKNWVVIRGCLIDSHVCKNVLTLTPVQKESEFYKMKLSPLQWSCCIPPPSCELEYKSPTVWTIPKSGLKMKNNTDCRIWNNDQDLLCYDCNSCKAGYLTNLRDKYRIFIVYDVLTILFLILVYFIGCCARRSNKYRYVKYSPYMSP